MKTETKLRDGFVDIDVKFKKGLKIVREILFCKCENTKNSCENSKENK